jgi:hypothetical protein
MALACLWGVAEKARRWLSGVTSCRNDRRLELGDFEGCHDGARKSRCSGCCDCVIVVLKLRDARAGAHALCVVCGVGSALRHLLETFIVVDLIDLVCRRCLLRQDASLSPSRLDW